MSEAFNGARLETLRNLLGLTQNELGARLGLTQSLLSRIEHGHVPLSEDLAALASQTFGEPIKFFQVPLNAVPLGPVAYRKKSTTRAAERARISELYREASRVFHEISAASGYRTIAPQIDSASGDIERAADAIRDAAGVANDAAVRNATRMLERLGIGVVVDLDDEAQSHDRADVSGISMPTKNNERPLVATTSIARGDVQRMTLAHELGHLVLHRDAPSINCSIRHPQEQEAYFLGALVLAPRHVMAARISESATLRHFLGVKSEFGVSAGAAVVHAHRLGLISTDRYRGLQMQMQARKWKYDEPGEVAAESPKLFAQALSRAYPTSTYARASHELGTRPSRLHRWAHHAEGEANAVEPTGSPTNVTPLRGRSGESVRHVR
jgi:Zn-dependent peptidase ImmA (M78 family)/DNA-binding XRE family transcriptional regulator